MLASRRPDILRAHVSARGPQGPSTNPSISLAEVQSPDPVGLDEPVSELTSPAPTGDEARLKSYLLKSARMGESLADVIDLRERTEVR